MYCNQSDLVTDTETITTNTVTNTRGSTLKKKNRSRENSERALKETPRHKKKVSGYQKT